MSLRLLFSPVVPLAFSLILCGCESKAKWEDFQGGIHLVLEVESKGSSIVDEHNTITTKRILSERMRQSGIRKRVIKLDGERRIVIQLPKPERPQRIIKLISQPCLLEFKLVDEDSSLEEALKGNVPLGSEILYQVSANSEGEEIKTRHLVKKRALLTGDYVTDASVRFDQYNAPYVSLSFDSMGTSQFARITEQNVGKRLAILLDNNVHSAPVINKPIPGGEAMISGRFTIDTARDMAIVLSAGAYPAHTKIIETKELTKDLWMGDMD